MSDKVYVQVGVKGRSLPVGGEAGQILQKASDKDFDLIWTTPAGGASANIPQPATSISPADSASGTVGSGVAFARQDHQHPINVSSTATDVKPDGTRALGSSAKYARVDHVHPVNFDDTADPEMDGVASPGTDAYYARRDHVHPTDTSRGSATALAAITPIEYTVSLDKDDWVTDNTYTDKHTIDITAQITSGTSDTVVDLFPDYTTIHQMMEDGTSGIYVDNTSGTFTAVAVGEKPTADLTIAARAIEV